MAVGFPKLGLTLQDALMKAGHSTPLQQPLPAPAPPPQEGMSKAAMIMGLLGDAIAANSGGQMIVALNLLRQREQAARDAREEANWGRRLERERGEKQWEWQNKPRDPSPMVRDLQTWQSLTPEQRQAFGEMQDARSGPVNVTLPGDRFYSGPKSGLAAALGATPTAGGNLPTVTDEASYQAVAPGGQYRDAAGNVRTKAGGGVGNGTSGFPR